MFGLWWPLPACVWCVDVLDISWLSDVVGCGCYVAGERAISRSSGAYHVVWCPKYRRGVIGGRMEARLKEIIGEVIAEKGAWLIEMETIPDHVHLLVEVDPQFGVHIVGEGHQGAAHRGCCARSSPG